MTDETRGDDFLFGPFKEFLDSLASGSTPSSLLSPDLVGRFLEIQRAMLQQTLGKCSGDAGVTRHEQEAVKALMRCSLEVMQSTRAYRESFIKAQSTLVERYVDLLDEALKKPEGSHAGPPEDDEPKSGGAASAQPKAGSPEA